MTQRGYIFRKGSAWYLRYTDIVLDSGGKPVRRKLCKRLADFGDRYRSKKSVRPLADEFLAPINAGKVRPESTMSVSAFIENEYLPYVERNKRPSTVKGYRDVWNVHIKARIGNVTLRDFRPADGTALLADIVAHASAPLGRRTVYHIKSLMSGVFAHAISQGWLDSDNPIRNVRIPGDLRGPSETAAYDLDTIEKMLALPELGDTARLAIALRPLLDCASASCADCGGKSTAGRNFESRARSGTAASQTQRQNDLRHLYLLYRGWRRYWIPADTIAARSSAPRIASL